MPIDFTSHTVIGKKVWKEKFGRLKITFDAFSMQPDKLSPTRIFYVEILIDCQSWLVKKDFIASPS
jgi:hypothetical protein